MVVSYLVHIFLQVKMTRSVTRILLIPFLFLQVCVIQAQAKDDPLNNKVIVIIGASSGFGKGTALVASKRGAHVIVAARRIELLNQLAKDCGNDAIAVQTDISDSDQVENLAAITLKKFGHIDIWINDVGVGAIGRFDEIPMKDHSRMIDVNLKGIVYGSHVAIRQFKKQNYGTLINLGSIDSEVPLAYMASYSATKAGVLSLGKALNEELRLAHFKRIKVSTILPWAVDTPWWDHSANYSGGTPRMGHMDDPDKVVKAIIKACIHPKEVIAVGWKAQGTYKAHRLMPNITERVAGDAAHKYQIKEAPQAPNTHGTLFEPMQSGTGIDGGVKERMKREKEAQSGDKRP